MALPKDLQQMQYFDEESKVSSLQPDVFYYTKGIDGGSDFTVCTIQNDRIFVASAWLNNEGKLHYYYDTEWYNYFMSVKLPAVNNMVFYDALEEICLCTCEDVDESWDFKEHTSNQDFTSFILEYMDSSSHEPEPPALCQY